MAFLRQLQLLLWKNGLAVKRQPVWSLTLIIWPLIIFIIVAVTRNQFPPIMRDTCYVAPRNLPSAGFFPFLQTLMCNTDSKCHNKSRLVDPYASKSSRNTRSTQSLKESPLANVFQGGDLLKFAYDNDTISDTEKLIKFLGNVLGQPHKGSSRNVPYKMNNTVLQTNETLKNVLQSVRVLKRAICTLILPMINKTSQNPVNSAVVNFCQTNNTVFEVTLQTLNQILTGMLMADPDEFLTVAGVSVVLFNEMQNESSLWETLQAIPQLLSSGSVDQAMSSLEVLLTQLQRALHVIESEFPGTSGPLSNVHPLLTGIINIANYAQNWPGKNVSIPLGDVVTLRNDSLGEIVQQVLQNVEIPLDKAIWLTLDKRMVSSYVCVNMSTPMWLSAACSTGTVDMLLGMVSADKVAKQALLRWSKHVAPSDVSVFKGLVHSLMGHFSPGAPGGSYTTRTSRSIDTQPANIEEELFLNVGHVVLELLKMVPEVHMTVQQILQTGFQSMKSTNAVLSSVEELMGNVLNDTEKLRMTLHVLLTNHPDARMWIDRVMDSVLQIIMEAMTSSSQSGSTCEDFLHPIEWLLSTSTVKMEVWRSMICHDNSVLEEALKMEWMDLVEQVHELVNIFGGNAGYNVTLPMILSEWHQLYSSSLHFGQIWMELASDLNEEYWKNWLPENITYDVVQTLQQSAFHFLVKFGEKLEKSHMWPVSKNYFHMVYWILTYDAGNTTVPANCSAKDDFSIKCDTGLSWPYFFQKLTQALWRPSPDVLVNSLKGSVNLLQHVYGGIYTNMAQSFLKQEVKGGDALSDSMINLMKELDDFVNKISALPDENINEPDVMVPLVSKLVQSTGLSPLLNVLFSDGPVNTSKVLEVAAKIGRLNQHLFTFNETDPAMSELEGLIMEFLSLEGNLRMSTSHIMGYSLLTYSLDVPPEDVARVKEAIRPFTNQTSAGIVEALLTALEQLSRLSSPDGDPVYFVLHYLQKIQDFMISLLRLKKTEELKLQSGQVNKVQVTDHSKILTDLLDLFTPEGIMNLTHAGPDAAQHILLQKFVALLPPEVKNDTARLFHDFKKLQLHIDKCAAGKDCLAGVSEIFMFLDQVLDMIVSADVNVTLAINSNMPDMEDPENEEIASIVFSLVLNTNDVASVKTFKQILHFVKLLTATPNITVTAIQDALRESNLTVQDLNGFAALAGAANVKDLLLDLTDIANVKECFAPQDDQTVTIQCVMRLINKTIGFLTQLPALRNNTAILSLIPQLANRTISDILKADFGSSPLMIVSHSLSKTLANIKMTLRQNQLNTPEIMNEIKMVEGLIELVSNMDPYTDSLNKTLMEDPTRAQTVYLQLVDWYLKQLEYITRNSSVSNFLQPFFHITQMQVTMQLAQTNLSSYITDKVEFLINGLQYPLDGAGLRTIGLTAVEIVGRVMDTITSNLKVQNMLEDGRLFNNTDLYEIEQQIKLNLKQIKEWMKDPSLVKLFSNMLQLGNSSIPVSAHLTDIQNLLPRVSMFLSEDQMDFLDFIANITQTLGKALMMAEQTPNFENGNFTAAILEVAQSVMDILTQVTGPIPQHVQQMILETVEGSLRLILNPDMSFAASRNISLHILKNAESLISAILPEEVAEYLVPLVKVFTTYFETISQGGGPEKWNEVILEEMLLIQSLLPRDSTALPYISTIVNITHFILESGQGNMSLWATFENASENDLPEIFGQIGKLLHMVLQLVTGRPFSISPSLGDLNHLVPVLEQIMTGKADQHTWNKFEEILDNIFWTLEITDLWDSFSSFIPTLEKIVKSLVKTMNAENAMIQSLQWPVMTLVTEIAQNMNTTRFNLSAVLGSMQSAIERTVKETQQANGTVKCIDILTAWEPVRQAAGLSPAAMAMWCNISLQPVLEAHIAAMSVYSQLDLTQTGSGPISMNATATSVVWIIRCLYQVSINRTHLIQDFIMTLHNQISALAGLSLSPEAQHHLYMQLQGMQLQNSLSSLNMVLDELLDEAPALKPYILCQDRVLDYILHNYLPIQNSSSSQDLFENAALMFLKCANISVNGLNGTSFAGTVRQVIQMMIDLKIFEDVPEIHQTLKQLLASNDVTKIMEKVVEMSVWLASTKESGMDLLQMVLPKIYDILSPVLSILTETGVLEDAKLLNSLVENTIAMLGQFLSTGGLGPPMGHHPGGFVPGMPVNNHQTKVRHKRDVSLMAPKDPIDDFIQLFTIDYPAMFQAISEPSTTDEIWETAHMFFANPDLGYVMHQAMLEWNASGEATVDAALELLSYLTVADTFEKSSLNILVNAVQMLPDDFPFASTIKNITEALANENEANLKLMHETFQTIVGISQISPTDSEFREQLGHLTSQVCSLEKLESVQMLLWTFSIQPGQLCNTVLPSLLDLVDSLIMNATTMSDVLFQTVVGDPQSYDVNANWTAVLSRSLGLDISSLRSLQINVAPPGAVTVGELLRNQTAFVQDVQHHMDFNPQILNRLLETTVPNNNIEILAWIAKLQDHCKSTAPKNMKQPDEDILKEFCSMSTEDWYRLSLMVIRRVDSEKVIYRLVLSRETQTLVGIMLKVAEVVTETMEKMLPAISQLQKYTKSFKDLNLVANNEFHQMTRGQRTSISTRATFVTLSRALCSNGILALFGISKLPQSSESKPSSVNYPHREEMIERFKIPRDASPFCMNMYLDMVNTTGGAIAWAFLKPMLMGYILYTPDTPATRAIMQKSNATLLEFANLRKYSQDWLHSSKYLVKSAELLSQTLPMLQNSLGNSFVKNFIEMQTDINVGRMRETLSSFSNMTLLLEKNKPILDQVSVLSTLMVDLSSCVKFDRYRGYDSAEQLNSDAQEFAKNRDLYASVIFKLPKDGDSSRKKRSSNSSSSSSSSLPPKVSYTIRMHMDNVMRTDRVRNPYFVKDTHISPRLTMRYNRGFIYLQENIDRAIIETQTGQRVSDTAVQLQPFPYPCFLRDEYLEAISFVFPLMLMIAWVLFVADFVKKLVHERELRLHEYMKMMGVNPVSHFFAWFLECAAYLVVTISILTLVLKFGKILPHSDGFLVFLYLCDYGLSVIAFSYLVSSFFDKTYIAGLSGSLFYIVCFFPFIVVMAVETRLTFSQKSALSLFCPTCFSYASQYVTRYENQGEGIHWSNSYISPIAGDTSSFGWLCWLMLIDSILYFIIGVYIRMVFPGKYGLPAPWYFPFQLSFWADLCGCSHSKSDANKGLIFTNILQSNQPVFSDNKGKGQSTLSSQAGEDFSELPVGVALHGLTKTYGDQVAIENLNVSFHEGHVTSLLGHNGAGKTTTMSLLTGLFAPSSGTIEVYGRDMQKNIDKVRKELGVCMQYDVLFDHMTTKEHLLLYGQIKAPHWSHGQLHEQVRTILQETGMYAHRHKLVGTLSGGMKRKLSISIAFIGGSRLVVLDEPTTGVDPCSRRSIWDIVIQHKKQRTIIMSTHHLDEAEVLSDRIAFLEKGGLKCCGSPFYLKDKLGQGYKLTLTKKILHSEAERIDSAELKAFIQAHVPEARLKDAQGGDLVYSLPPFTSSNASSYRSLLTALDSNLDALQLGGYGISDTTLEEVFLHLTQGNRDGVDGPLSISETLSDSASVDSFPSDISEGMPSFDDRIKLNSSSTVSGMALAWQQMSAMLIKRFHHSRRDWKGLISQLLLPVLFVVFAMGLGSIKSDLQHYAELELSPSLYNIGPSYSFFSNQNPSSKHLVDSMMSFPGIDNACLDKANSPICRGNTNKWISSGNRSSAFRDCKCTQKEQVCYGDSFHPPHKSILSSQIVYNLSGINLEKYLVATANDFIRNRYGGFAFGMPLPPDLQLDIQTVPKNRTLSKVWFNPEGHHTMPAYLNSLNNLILRANLPADKDPRKYAISVSSHPYFGRADDEDAVVQGMLQILVAMCVLTGFSIMTASFAIYEVQEHHTGSKRLQHIAGISEPFYWTVNFIYDMAIYMIPVALTVAVIAAFQIPAFTDRNNLGAITLLLVLFGFATFPWMYLLAGVFKDAEMAFITFVCINLFISVNTIVSTSILHFISQIAQSNPEAIQETFKKLCHAFYIFPQFNFGNGLMELARMNVEVQLLSGYGIDAYRNPFSAEALGWMFFSSFIQGLFFFSLRLLLNKSLKRKVSHLICGKKTMGKVSWEDEDEDVVAEHERVSSGAAHSDILQVNQLTKVYELFKKKIHAVKRLSVGIPAGECFGLLGVNGAGKTTTFKMLTGDVSPTEGTAQIRDWDGRLVDIMECRNKGINIGYCPQVDALDNLLTGEEHLYFYARIHGISKRQIDGAVNYLLKRLELNHHRKIITDSYSCGTRRKLSTALALIGHPQILLLDEPSSGMDPRTKRHLWKIISDEVKGKCAVVLTSHSMEECEALCSRLAIMVKGQFRCLGSLQHIKNRFGSGFTVKMYMAEASCDAEAITGFMQHRFPTTYLKDQHSAMVEYHVPFAPGGVADIFNQLESNKNALRIKHFSVCQTTLDEVFINFAMGKIGMQTIPIDNDEEFEDQDSMDSVKT